MGIGAARLPFDGHAGLLAGGIPGLAPGVSRLGLRRSQSQQHPLVLEQPAFTVQTAAEAGELAAHPDHAVTGDNDRDGILAVGGAYGARRVRVAETARQLAVAGGGAVGNGTQQIPNTSLEWRAGGVERQAEGCAGSVEIFVKLPAGARGKSSSVTTY